MRCWCDNDKPYPDHQHKLSIRPSTTTQVWPLEIFPVQVPDPCLNLKEGRRAVRMARHSIHLSYQTCVNILTGAAVVIFSKEQMWF